MRRDRLAWAGIAILVAAGAFLVFADTAGLLTGFANTDLARLAALVAMLVVIGGGVVFGGGARLASLLGHAAVWLVIALGLILIYSYRTELTGLAFRMAGELAPAQAVRVVSEDGTNAVALRRGMGGMFAAEARVNGASVRFLVDTGASRLTLTASAAREAGIDPDRLRYSVMVQTANGTALVAPVRIGSVEIGPLTFPDVPAFVAPEGTLGMNLLGMNVLDRLDSYEVRGNEMILRVRS